MSVDPTNVDFTGIEDVTNIEPAPTLAEQNGELFIGPLGDEGKGLMKELLDALRAEAASEVPVAAQAFERLGVPYGRRSWNGWEVYWAGVSDEEVLAALREWHRSFRMQS